MRLEPSWMAVQSPLATAVLYREVARRAFQRYLAYRTANLAGAFTNAIFGYLRAEIMLAVYMSRQEIAGYSAGEAVTYLWVAQATLMVVGLWGWWEIEQTIRTGDVVADLSKPFSYLGYWLARDLGRAGYFLIFRCVPMFLVGQLVTGLIWPTSLITWLAFSISLALGVVVSFCWRFIVNLSAFWTTDARGLGGLVTGLVTLLAGFVVPLPFFPEPFRSIAFALPFVGMTQAPADIFLGRVSGTALLVTLMQQLAWSLALLALCQVVLSRATRRVLVQGG